MWAVKCRGVVDVSPTLCYKYVTPANRIMASKEWHSNYKKYRRQKIKDYLGGKCMSCGSTENLQFDHRDRSTKKFNIAREVCMAWDRLTEEADKCDLLCKSCHIIKTRAHNDAHETLKGYVLQSIVNDDDTITVTYVKGKNATN